MFHSPSVKLTAFAFPMGSFGSAHQTHWNLYSKYPGWSQSRSASGSAAGDTMGGGIPSSGSGSAGRHHKWGSGFRFGFRFGLGVRVRARGFECDHGLQYWSTGNLMTYKERHAPCFLDALGRCMLSVLGTCCSSGDQAPEG